MNEEEKTLIFARQFVNDKVGIYKIDKAEIKILLNLIDRLKEENEDLRILKDDLEDRRFIYTDTPEFKDTYLPKQKIKDKIKKLERRKDAAIKINDFSTLLCCEECDEKIYLYQELLEDEE